MAAQPLFDIASIDLDRVAIGPDEIAALNPQSGHMRHLNHVIWHAEDFSRLLGVKNVRDDEFWVPGHIPGRPLLPGVLMIEAAAQLASISFRKRTGITDFLAFTRLTDVSFRAQVVPGDRLLLLVVEERFQPRRFTCRAQGIVQDAMAFEATIGGMVVREGQGRG